MSGMSNDEKRIRLLNAYFSDIRTSRVTLGGDDWVRGTISMFDNINPLNTPDESGRTLLMKTAAAGYLTSVNLLLEKHAKAGIVDHSGKNAASYATTDVIRTAIENRIREEATLGKTT